jgi:hypothetical protein
MSAFTVNFNHDLISVLEFCGHSLIKTLKFGGADVKILENGKWIINDQKIQEFPVECKCDEDQFGDLGSEFHQHYELRFVDEFEDLPEPELW